MLSPPYSPHVDSGSKQDRDLDAGVRAASTLSSNSSTYATSVDDFTDVDSDISSGTTTPNYGCRSVKSASPAAFDAHNLGLNVTAFQHAAKVRVVSSWNALRANPAQYRREQQAFLALYPMQSLVPGAEESDDAEVNSSPSKTRPARGKRAKSHRSIENIPPNLRGRKRTSDFSQETAPSGVNEDTKDSVQHVRVHDLSLSQIEDFSPPLHLLPPGKSLRAEWKGAPMDLSNDKDLHLLHPAEAHLASVLRLPCDVYLDSKRRLFAEKVHRLRQGLPFRRTDSQKACRIDVNKASRLFGAFEKIGWLEDELFLKYLN